MIAKLPVLGFALVTAFGSSALAHEGCPDAQHTPPNPAGAYGGGRPTYHTEARTNWRADELAYSDLNRDGWVTLDEALDHGRREFRREDRDRNRVLTRHELGRGELRRADRNRDGVVTHYEHESALRADFARHDRNRDGVLARYEVAYDGAPAPAPAPRRVGWWR